MRDRPEYNEDFVDVLAAFAEAGVEFIVMGAHALAARGVVRASGDLDLFVRPTEENAARVVQGLEAFGAPLQAHGVTQADFTREGTVYQLGLPPRRIDVLTAVSGLSYDEAVEESTVVSVGDVTIRVPSARKLLLNKKASGRPKDLEDARRLEELIEGHSVGES